MPCAERVLLLLNFTHGESGKPITSEVLLGTGVCFPRVIGFDVPGFYVQMLSEAFPFKKSGGVRFQGRTFAVMF